MQQLTRSFQAKVFLMFLGTLLVLYAFNQGMLNNFGPSEVRRIYDERQTEQNLRWSRQATLPASADVLQLELLQAMRTAHPGEVRVFTQALDDAPPASPARFPLLPELAKASATPGVVTEHFPLVAKATVDLDGRRWNATRLIAQDRIVVSLVDQSAHERDIAEYMEFRGRMVRMIMPLSLLLAIPCAMLLTRRVLAPTRRIQKSLRRLDFKDLSVRISGEAEDREFREFIDAFNAMLERLERGFQQATRFSSDAAHELRTPLTIMQGYIERAIREAPPESRMQSQLCMISDEIERLTSITHKLLLLAQADTGRLRMAFEVVNISDLLEDMRADVAMIDPPLELRGKVEPDLLLKTDRALFQQLLNNLFSNAVKYNDEDGWIEMSAWAENGKLHIRFMNPSQLVDKAFEAKVFDRFSRADASRSRRIDGIGLGLSLCREIALANHGTLEFRVNQGNVVSVEFVADLHLSPAKALEHGMLA